MLLGTAAATNFAARVAGYAMHTADSETESFNILKGVSEGIDQINTFSSILGRAAGRFIANYVPNYMFENLF